jgi:predicted permease
MIDAIRQDLRGALRQLRQSPGTSAVIVAILGITIAATATLFSLLHAIVLRPLSVRAADRLITLSLTDKHGRQPALFAYAAFDRLAGNQDVFEDAFAYSSGGVLKVDGSGQLVDAAIVVTTPEYFPALGARALHGRVFTSDDAPRNGEPAHVVVLGYHLWSRLFGAQPSAVGQSLTVEGVPLTIVGVLPREFNGIETDLSGDFYVPLTLWRRLSGEPNRPITALHVVGHIRPGISFEHARAALATTWPAIHDATLDPKLQGGARADALAQRLQIESGTRGFSDLRRLYGRPLAILQGMAIALLLLACVNVGGLLLARAAAREHTRAVCLALGASRGRLIRPVLAEGLILTIAATLLAMPAASILARTALSFLWAGRLPLTIAVTPDMRVLLALGLGAVMAGLTVAWLPALASGRADLRPLLQSGRTTTSSANRAGRRLQVVQIAMSLVLLVGSCLMVTTLSRLRAIDLGFDPHGLLVTRAWQKPGPPRTYDEQTYYPRLIETLSAIPGVRSVALSQYFPAYFDFSLPLQHASMVGDDGGPSVDTLLEYISPRFFETAGSAIVRGRDITWADRAGSSSVVVIDETFARTMFSSGDPIGRHVRIGSAPQRQSLEVIGVARDLAISDLHAPHTAVAFRPRLQEPSYMRVPIVTLRASGDTAAVRRAVGPAIASLGEEYADDVSTSDEMMDVTLATERMLAALSSAFAAIAGVLAFAGLSALLGHAVVRRSREIGVRLAIGATRTRVVMMVIRDGLALTMTGAAIGVAVALASGRFIAAYLYGVRAADPWILAGASAALILAGVIAALWPAMRAARVNPVNVLNQ